MQLLERALILTTPQEGMAHAVINITSQAMMLFVPAHYTVKLSSDLNFLKTARLDRLVTVWLAFSN